MSDLLSLHNYWRSSASYRVRIALNLKKLRYEYVAVSLFEGGGQQHASAFHRLNPQELVPVLTDGERIVRQSLAIIEYLDETYHDHGQVLMPPTARERARVRALAHLVASDIAPINNLRVLDHLQETYFLTTAQREAWVRHWIEQGFRPLEEMLAANPGTGEFCEGDAPTLADCCLLPQVYNAQRFGVDLGPFPTIRRIAEHCNSLEAFDLARPEKQPDAPR